MSKADDSVEGARAYLRSVVSPLIDKLDFFTVHGVVDTNGVLLSVTLAPPDMPKVIGKGGQVSQAIRTLLRIYGIRNNMRISMKILEPDTAQ